MQVPVILSLKDNFSLSQCSVQCVEKHELEKLKKHITLNKRRESSNKRKYSQQSQNVKSRTKKLSSPRFSRMVQISRVPPYAPAVIIYLCMYQRP